MGRDDRYDDDYDEYDGYDRDDDDYGGYGGMRGKGEPPSRGSRTASRGRGRSPEWNRPPADTDDSVETPASGRGGRGNMRGAGSNRSGRGYDEADDGSEELGAYGDQWSRSPRPSQRRGDDRDPRVDRGDRGERDADDWQDRGSRPRGSRYDDPLEDPRAPGFLRAGAAPRDAGRPGSSVRNGRDAGYDDPSGGKRPPSTPSRQGRQDYAEYAEKPWRSGPGARDDMRGRGSSSRLPPRSTPEPRKPDPLEDSWGMSAFSSEGNAIGWTDPSGAWGAAPSEEYSAAMPGYRGPAGARNTRNSRKAGRAARTDSGQRGKLIALGVFVVVLVFGGGVFIAPKLLGKGSPSATTLPSAFATYTQGPTPTPAPNFTLFTSKRSAYIVTYPQAWSATQQPSADGDNLDAFAAPGGLPMFRVEQATGFSGVSNDDVINGEVQSAKKIDASAIYTENVSAATTEAIGGEQWVRREFDVTNEGVKYHMAILSCHHIGKGYVIVLVTAPADFAKYSSGAFQTMLTSFRFVG